MPLSLTGDARLHTSGGYSFTVGLKGYFGGTDDGKSLIDRQRQDDPPNRAIDLFTAAGNQLYQTAPPPVDPETACLAQAPTDPEHVWTWTGTDCESVFATT